MNRSKSTCRIVHLLPIAAAALVLALTPVSAADPAITSPTCIDPSPEVDAMNAPAQTDQAFEVSDVRAVAETAASPDASCAQSAELSDGENEPLKVFTPTVAAKPMRGFCRCTCTFVPNCSTNADCGGGLCLKGPTCC